MVGLAEAAEAAGLASVACQSWCGGEILIDVEASEARDRQHYPENNIADWPEKCSWDGLCAGCAECTVENNQGTTCVPFCEILTSDSMTAPWKKQTLSWNTTCAWGPCHGCDECMRAGTEERERVGLAFNEYRLDSVAGDENFDPMNIASSLPADQRLDMQRAEMLNGRLASASTEERTRALCTSATHCANVSQIRSLVCPVLAVTAYVLIEFVFDQSIVSFTPDLFQPLFLAPDFRAFMDASFGMASMDGSIDGIAY